MDRTAAQPASPTADRRGSVWAGPVLDHIVWLILLAVLAAFSLTIPGFFQAGTFTGILQQSTFVGILAVGLSLVIIAGQMDLSIESVLALSAMTTALLLGTTGPGLGWAPDPPWLVVPVTLAGAILLGGLIGLVNAALVVRFKVNAFVVTLAAYVILFGAAVASSGNRAVSGLPAELRAVGAGTILDVPVPTWILVAVFVAFGLVLARTPFGRRLSMTGSRPGPAQDGAGRLVTIAFMLSGGLAAFAGWLLAAGTARVTPYLGVGMLFETFAAVVIGGVSLKGGAGRLSGVFAGVLLLSAIHAAIDIMGMPPLYLQVIQGALVLTAVLLDTLKASIRKRYP
ncbi:ABC transporter permease [Inquilinus sp. Marseille-Q2685]|uniref:ABC transporter permease n=1 Tax=Inquilinus sp. Marseille-Q2685 TaxID=2866581 RepID=UPI001CE41352|nr:ABC transporter permease [Inquilinus sp. Marseille-Q2685]